jgi:acetoin utilization protein AcuB
MDVQDVMSTPVTTVTPDTLVQTASRVMRDAQIRHLPIVTDEATLVGILTDRDLRRAVPSDVPHLVKYEQHSQLDQLRVREIMTPEVLTVRGPTALREAGQLVLQHKVGCLPVVRNHHTLVGIITVTDLLRVFMTQHEAGRVLRVRSVMHTPLITITPEMSLAEAHRLMRIHHIRHLPVVRGPGYQRLVGMLTDRDLREATPSPATTLTRGRITAQMATTAVQTCMTTLVLWIGPEAELAQAARLLVERRIGCLPVVDHGTLVGMVTARDCVQALLQTASET